jgi:hypothetical protein
LKEYVGAIYVPVIAGATMFFTTYFGGNALNDYLPTPIWTVLMQIAIGAVSYIMVVGLLGRHLIKELLSLRK